MNIHKLRFPLLGGLLFLLTGCIELNREDFTEIYPDNFFKTETDLKLAVDGLYYDLELVIGVEMAESLVFYIRL